MKYTMLKIGVFAVCCIGGNSTYSQELPSKHSVKKIFDSSYFFVSQQINIHKKNADFVPLLGLTSHETLSTYNYGLRFLKNDYCILNEADQIRAIRSHFSYLGKSSQPLTQSEIVTQLEKSSNSFFIFEMEIQKQSHFYLVHPKGTRHFIPVTSPMKSGELIASIKNATEALYPNIDYFIRSTFANYI